MVGRVLNTLFWVPFYLGPSKNKVSICWRFFKSFFEKFLQEN